MLGEERRQFAEIKIRPQYKNVKRKLLDGS